MNPLVAKVGGGAVASAAVITGGVLLHKHFEFPKGLDKELINEEEASVSISDESNFELISGKLSEVIIKAKASSTKTESSFSAPEKWTCNIVGVAKGGETISLNLSTDDSSGNFNKASQKTKFTSKLGDNKEGFVKSCARNRTAEQSKSENLNSDIVVELKATGETGSQKYEFSDEDVTKIFEGNWINPK